MLIDLFELSICKWVRFEISVKKMMGKLFTVRPSFKFLIWAKFGVIQHLSTSYLNVMQG